MLIDRIHIDADRYLFDFKLCQYAQGWAQWNTTQDASYYGTWINPFRLAIVNYAEGDVTVTKCVSEAEFKAAARETAAWHRAAGYSANIDPGLPENPSSAQIFTRLRALGLIELMHASDVPAFETG